MSNEKENSVVLYCSWFCPYAQKAWIALEVKNVPYQYYEIDPYKSSTEFTKISKSLEEKSKEFPDFVRVSPLGLVPALNHNGNGICESTVCLEYIDEVFPGHSLLPKSPVLRARARFIGSYCGDKIISHFYKMLMTEAENDREKAKNSILEGLKGLISFIDPQGPFFLGEEFGYADIMLVPWWQRFLSVGKHYRNLEVPDTPDYSRLHKWYSACLAYPAYARTIVDSDRLIKNYIGYANNTATSQVAQLTRLKS